MRSRLLSWAVVCLAISLLCGASPIRAEEKTEAKVRTITLNEAVQIAMKTHPEVLEARIGVDIAKTRLDEALGYKRPQITLVAFVAPVTKARGRPLDTPDSMDKIHGITDWERADLMITQPLYTFGKISNYAAAATAGIEVDKARVLQKSGEIIIKTIEYYQGYILANELHDLVIEVKDIMDDAKVKLDDLLERDTGDVTDMDRYKLHAYYGLVEKNRFKVLKSIKLAKEAVKMMLGIPKRQELEIKEKSLKMADVKLEDLFAYQERAKDQRPEFMQIEHGLKAREHLIEAHKSERWPDVFVAAVGAAARSTGRDRHDDPFIIDPFNQMYGTALLGLKWGIDFGITRAKIDRAIAEKNQLLATKRLADQGIPVQVAKAWRDAMEYKKGVVALEDSYKNGKKWMVAASSNFDLGLDTPEEIFKAMTIYAMVKADYLQSIYNYNLSVAELLHMSGDDIRFYSIR